MTSPARRRRRRGGATTGAEAAAPPPVWPGVEGGRFTPLSEAEAALVHETALDLLEDLGLGQATPDMIRLVRARGGRLSGEGRLLFPRALVSWAIEGARRDVVLYGQRPGLEIDLSGRRVHTSSGGASPSILDLRERRYRGATTKDLYDAARIVDRMEHIHHFSRSLVAGDAPDPLSLDLNTAYACLAGTAKPVSVSISDPANVPAVAELCHTLAGGEGAFRERPFLSVMVCHVVPPMRFASEACETLGAAIRAGFPVQIISAGQAGATSPATLAGSLVQAIAETLAGFVFARLVDERVRAIFAPKPLVADLRTGAMSGGGGEQAILMAAAAQMGRRYDLPTSSIAGITDAKLPDAQHGYEKNLAVTLAAHAGANLITQACGMQASLLGASLEAYVIDNDMLGNVLRTVRGVEAGAGNAGAGVIAQVCRGEGHYLGHAQTRARMKSDYCYPSLGDRRPPGEWERDGTRDLLDRAGERARAILDVHFPRHLSDAAERRLRALHPLLLSRREIGRA